MFYIYSPSPELKNYYCLGWHIWSCLQMSPKSRGWACTDPQTWRLDLRIKIKFRAISNKFSTDWFIWSVGLRCIFVKAGFGVAICYLQFGKVAGTENGGVVHFQSDWLKNMATIFILRMSRRGWQAVGPTQNVFWIAHLDVSLLQKVVWASRSKDAWPKTSCLEQQYHHSVHFIARQSFAFYWRLPWMGRVSVTFTIFEELRAPIVKGLGGWLE